MTWHTALFTTATIIALALTGIASAKGSDGDRGGPGSDGGVSLQDKRPVRILGLSKACPPTIACNDDSTYIPPRYQRESNFDCDYLLEQSRAGNSGYWQFRYRQCIRFKQ